MRVLTISGPGVATDDECCPHGQVRLEDGDGDHVCGLCHVDTRQPIGQQRIRAR
jgi:hypothetical protein